ncbi:ABC transporter substrate-binding protein [Tessaracoccus caeni]|uniref:ABC transporter substrate-binding protein n=1 Tax=Tessaracoccus caeni TaxID=3031239 RepID=UPI0023D9D6EF|nr:sugar ABC transporter substrate-binding protein [Tessaracoccus caeni]MDF1489409.1 sugar ABC transporter substrate-binding protein [Tessaracoccus caeni]
MKKWKSVAAGLAAVALLATGCGGSGDDKGGDASALDIWLPPLAVDNVDAELWEDILKPFEEDNGIDVNVTIVPWDAFETKYLTGVSSGQGPDVGYMYTEMIGDYIAKDQIVALDDKVTDAQRENLIFLDRGEINGSQMMMPFVVGGARVLFYNKELFAKAGITEPPANWDDLVEVSLALREAGIEPLAMPWGDPNRGSMNAQFFPFVWQAGGQLFEADGSATKFDSPEMLKAAEYLKRLKDEGVIGDSVTGLTTEVARKTFESGDVAMYIASEADAPYFDNAGIDYGFVISLTDQQQGTFIALDSLVMLKGCSDQEACYKLMSFITEGPQMTKFHAKTNFPPIGRDEQSNYPEEMLAIYTENTDMLYPLPVVANGPAAYNTLYSNLQQMLGGSKTPEQALADAAAEGNTALSQGVQ